ncbi:hypothetical protein EWH99_10960 [Sporolactobacillus sp. THM7-7]|nr:hypothetical protein EWH99_10960 [Sporolactobacillus sp. THM7-7]
MGDVNFMANRERKYSRLVENPVLEDYSLRYAPKSFRKWSPWMVFLAGIGSNVAMASYAIGGTLTVSFGVVNTLLASLCLAVLVFITGTPIAYEIGKNNIDMDLLTRGAGFGYLGSTLTSLIYASFTIIYFALEGAIMGQAITSFFHIPLWLSYLVSSIVIIPLVLYGMTALSKFQAWTQPIWLILITVAIVGVISQDKSAMATWMTFTGSSNTSSFSPALFAAATGVLLSLLAQIGEQADFLRFMPDKTEKNRKIWMAAVIAAGPGWVILAGIQQVIGSFFAANIAPSVGLQRATDPATQFDSAFQTVFGNPLVSLSIATFLVLLSQLKINATNAYSGSLSWSNFFSRTLHFHPGRVVWLIFQVIISALIMIMGMINALNTILGFYSNVAVAWIGAVFADITINKKLLKISPPYIEFKRAHLYNFNPVGFGSMIIASILSIATYFGVFGSVLQPYSAFISLFLAIILSPVIALLTHGKYYIARDSSGYFESKKQTGIISQEDQTDTCVMCGHEYEVKDMAYCPFHEGPICSLCCSLESACHDTCKTSHSVGTEASQTS